jgi:hypothetical protein
VAPEGGLGRAEQAVGGVAEQPALLGVGGGVVEVGQVVEPRPAQPAELVLLVVGAVPPKAISLRLWVSTPKLKPVSGSGSSVLV